MIISSWPSNNAEVRGTNPPSSWKFALTLYSALHICGPASVIQPASDHVVLSSLFRSSVLPDSLQLHGLQHARLPCPSLPPGVCSNSCPFSRWCHPTISSSLTHPLLLPSVFPSISVFSNESALHIRRPKYWSFSISPSNEYPGLISFRIDWSCSPRDSQESSPAPQLRGINSSALSLLYGLSHPYMTTGKTIALTLWTFIGKMMSLLFNTLSRFVITFLPRNKRLNFMAVVRIYWKTTGKYNCTVQTCVVQGSPVMNVGITSFIVLCFIVLWRYCTFFFFFAVF